MRRRGAMFRDRRVAGTMLAERLLHLAGPQLIVLGLPRGGVPVARVVADVLGAPLDVILVRKIGVPSQPELAMGAVGEDGVRVHNRTVIDAVGIPAEQIEQIERSERAELERRGHVYRSGRPRRSLRGRVALIIDDGVATGATARAACRVARAEGATRVVLAVPVAPDRWSAELTGEADELIAVETPSDFGSVGRHYGRFPQVGDEEVIAALARHTGVDEDHAP
ncbi:MAG: phosphoribosyltransferase [Acidimicrobiales bacterium]